MKDTELISQTSITCLMENTSPKEYGVYTDKLIVIKQNDNVVILNKQILEYLESVVGAKFKS